MVKKSAPKKHAGSMVKHSKQQQGGFIVPLLTGLASLVLPSLMGGKGITKRSQRRMG